MGDGDGDGDGGGLRDEMDKTAELAERFGISGDDGDPEDEEVLKHLPRWNHQNRQKR